MQELSAIFKPTVMKTFRRHDNAKEDRVMPGDRQKSWRLWQTGRSKVAVLAEQIRVSESLSGMWTWQIYTTLSEVGVPGGGRKNME